MTAKSTGRNSLFLSPAVAASISVVLAALQPLHVAPEVPVFTNTSGEPIEPKAFSRHWYDGLRALGIRQRGLYCTKDTFVTTALAVGVKIAWLEAQTGVVYETLRRHYGKWVPLEIDSELRRFEDSEPGLFPGEPAKLHPTFRDDGVQLPNGGIHLALVGPICWGATRFSPSCGRGRLPANAAGVQ